MSPAIASGPAASHEILVGLALRAQRGGRAVLDVDRIALRRGELLVVLGPNGAGKSTLLRTLAMLEPPAGGSVRFKAWSGTEAERELRRHSAVVFQRPHFWHEPVAYNVGLGLRLRGRPVTETDERVARICGLLGLGHRLRATPGDLSAGEAQRVALARALVLRPEILFLDEPMGNLDSTTRAGLRADLELVARQRATSVLMATSDCAEAFRVADRIAVLEGGRLQQVATPAELFTSPAGPFTAGVDGVELTLRGRVTRAHGRTLEVELGGARLIAVGDAGEGAHVKVAYRPADLALFRAEDAPGGAGARNLLFLTVAARHDVDGLVRLRLEGPARLAALVTPAAAAELGVGPGTRLAARLEPTALRAYPTARESRSADGREVEPEGPAVPGPAAGRAARRAGDGGGPAEEGRADAPDGDARAAGGGDREEAEEEPGPAPPEGPLGEREGVGTAPEPPAP